MAAAKNDTLSFNAAWAMAVGGMVGGGIFSVLGVVVEVAGAWAWVSFVLAGLVALATGHSYARLADQYGEGGGAFRFLREIHRDGFAGSLSWVLVIGYTLTLSVYAFTFGHYLAEVFGAGAWLPRACAVAVMALLVGLNLRGVGDASRLEVVAVWGKLAILVGLAAFGLYAWQPEKLAEGVSGGGWTGALQGAASVFMAYEGFQLLAYDYGDIDDAKKTMPRAVLSAIVVVIGVYVVVTLGATMLVGAQTVVEKQEVALAVAGRAALGTTGFVLATVAAVFSTASAINATLFATARLAETVAKDDELPAAFAHENGSGVPDRAVLLIGGLGAALAVIGSLGTLVEAASLIFLFTFATVNVLAWRAGVKRRWVSGAGALGAAGAALALTVRLAQTNPVALGVLGALVLVATAGRPVLLRHVRTA